jgi:hypothetical protein
MYFVETRADNSGYTNHRVICLLSSLRRQRQHLGRLSFFVRVHFSKTIKCIHLKLGILVHLPIIVYIEKIVFLEKKCKQKKWNNSNKMLDGVVFSCQQIGVNTFSSFGWEVPVLLTREDNSIQHFIWVISLFLYLHFFF